MLILKDCPRGRWTRDAIEIGSLKVIVIVFYTTTDRGEVRSDDRQIDREHFSDMMVMVKVKVMKSGLIR